MNVDAMARRGGRSTDFKRYASRIVLYALLALFVLYFATPLYVMLVTSFKSLEEIRMGGLLSPPSDFVTAAWDKAWNHACSGLQCLGVKPFFWNSVVMVVPAVAISTAIGAINGYVLTKWRFTGAELVFAFLLFGCFIPFQIVILPMARVLGLMGLSGSLAGLILVHIIYGIGFTTLYFRNYYVAVPTELVKAARIDGAGFFQIFFLIFLPISGPVIVVTVIWQFTAIWNDFLFGVVFAQTDSYPVTVALNNLVNSATGVKEYNVEMSAALIAAIPTLIVYIVGGRYFIRGLTAGSVKG